MSKSHMDLVLQRGISGQRTSQRTRLILGRIPSFSAAALMIFSLSGCATLVEGGAQTIRIETEPPDARCILKRSGAAVSVIPSTPAAISVFKQKGDLELTCSKRGYLDAKVDQAAAFSGTVLGNVLFGGLVGAAIDMGSGATHKYPEWIFLTLIPEAFENHIARDDFFASLVNRVERKHDEAIKRKLSQCTEDDCDRDIEKMNEAHQARLRAIEAQRQNAIIGSVK